MMYSFPKNDILFHFNQNIEIKSAVYINSGAMSSVTITEVLEANEEVLNGLNRLLPQLSSSASSLNLSGLQVFQL